MEQNKSWFFLLVSSLIFAGVFLFVGFALISSLKTNQSSNQGITNTISVVGEGKSSVAPDTLEINLSVSEVDKTTALAQKASDDKVNKVIALLTSKNISKDNIQTTNLNVYPEYAQVTSPVPVATQPKITGYRSQQSINIKVNGDNFATKWGEILDQIAAIGGINIDSTNFTLKDQTAAMKWAREKAFADAKAKAEQLAKISGVSLGKPVMITDNATQYTPIPYYAKAMVAGAADTNSAAPLSPGQSEVSLSVSVVYEIK